MQTQRGRAVAASADGNRFAAMAAALNGAGYDVAGRAGSAAEALALARDVRPSILLSDAILPGADGVALAIRLSRMPLNLYPGLLLARTAGLRLPGEERLEALGAALIDDPATPAGIRAAARRLDARLDPLPPEKSARLDALLDRLGVPAHPGRDALRRAVALAWQDRRRIHNLRDSIYPAAGAPFGRTAAQAERAIRHVIDAAWRTGEIDEQQRIFGDTIDARRGRPTCGEMIAQLADILRWEG